MLRSQIDTGDLEEELDELDQNIKRLRIEFDQYFLGVLKRPPTVLQGKVQKVILRLASAPPLSTRHRFRFNQLNSRFQIFRQQWGRTLREIEAGTYRGHLFKAKLHQAEQGSATVGSNEQEARSERREKSRRGDPLDRLADALNNARRKTGDHTALDRAKLADTVRRQTAVIRDRYGDVKVTFKVVIEKNKAKLKASVAKR